jgi:hypothetical protein
MFNTAADHPMNQVCRLNVMGRVDGETADAAQLYLQSLTPEARATMQAEAVGSALKLTSKVMPQYNRTFNTTEGN